MARVERPELKADWLATPIATARRLLAEGKTLEDVWSHLRAAGHDMFDSQHVTMAVTGLSAFDAKRALYLSETWKDMQPVIDQMENAMIEAALEMGAAVRIDGEVVKRWPPDDTMPKP